ncbi:hypothetical protein [uncultured phage cr77_1]|uniref:DUF7841 domain-containing protein n=1 Tax=uncultured phage cr77_1 TaxID=2986410 RepID=A0AAE7RUT0_9CAUD|nr:hypothetical protein M1M50_gp017 [uncultured phage cr77_1]QWM89761.1 hypothetical protein [uncultured phage cr77_1]
MHLNKILDQIKHHPSPTEAIDKLGKALEKHEGSLLEKGFQILKSELCANVYEAINGPHFDEEHARYAVEGMENEDGTKGPHWTVEETTSVANQMGINLRSEKHNKWDWYVAMNMIYSDFYKAVVAMTGSNNTKHFAELTKAWICDKDISEGKMNADNRLSICQQTNTLQNAITSGFNNLSSENATRFNILGSKIDAQTQIINDKFCQLEMREMQNKIDALRDEKNALQTSAITQQQTQNIVNQIKPCPVPAYLTCNPYGCNGGFTGYGYGYGYGDSCCA